MKYRACFAFLMSLAAALCSLWVYAILPTPIPVDLSKTGAFILYASPAIIAFCTGFFMASSKPEKTFESIYLAYCTLIIVTAVFNYVVVNNFLETDSLLEAISAWYEIFILQLKSIGIGAATLFGIAGLAASDEEFFNFSNTQ